MILSKRLRPKNKIYKEVVIPVKSEPDLPKADWKISGLLFLPDENLMSAMSTPAVIICHGLGSRKERHIEFADFLLQNGYSSLVLDLRGHGQSEGFLNGYEWLDVLAGLDYLAGISLIDHNHIAVRGSSFGGLTALRASMADKRLKAAVAICPAVEDALNKSIEENGLPDLIDDRDMYARIDSHRLRQNLIERNILAEIKSHSPEALLLIHALNDETISFEWSWQLYELSASAQKDLLLCAGGSHASAQHDLYVHQFAVDWLNRIFYDGR